LSAGASTFPQLALNPEAARAAPLPIRKNESRLEILVSNMAEPPSIKAQFHLRGAQSLLPSAHGVNDFKPMPEFEFVAASLSRHMAA
jgi:hypothetical protein